jgi:hypothetical protein
VPVLRHFMTLAYSITLEGGACLRP